MIEKTLTLEQSRNLLVSDGYKKLITIFKKNGVYVGCEKDIYDFFGVEASTEKEATAKAVAKVLKRKGEKK